MEPINKILRTPSALVLLFAAILTLLGVIIKSKSDEAIARIPINATLTAEAKLTQSVNFNLSTPKLIATETPNSFPSQTPSTLTELVPPPSIYIAEWKGATLFPSDALIVSTLSCKEDMPNAGLEPLYWIIYEVWISFTFVNSTDLPNGIISIEPIYKDYIEREWKSANWDISIYEDNSTDKPVSLPIELPPKTPRKFYFRAIHFAGITPERGVDPVITYGNTLSPLTWTFNIVNSEEVTHTSDLYISDGEAANDGIYKFADDCISILPEWGRLSIPGRAIP